MLMSRDFFDTYDFPELKTDESKEVEGELQEREYPMYIWIQRQSNDYSFGYEKVVTDFVNLVRKFWRVAQFLCEDCSRPKVMQFTSQVYYDNRYTWSSGHKNESFVDVLPRIIRNNYKDVDYELFIGAPSEVNVMRLAEMGLAVRIGIEPDMKMESAGELVCKLWDIFLSRKWFAYCEFARPDGFAIHIDQPVFRTLWEHPEKMTATMRNETLYKHLHDEFHMIPDLWGNRQEVMQGYLDKRRARLDAIAEHMWLTQLPKCC